jgi:uncharacterized SAM-dependent methyltransferase
MDEDCSQSCSPEVAKLERLEGGGSDMVSAETGLSSAGAGTTDEFEAKLSLACKQEFGSSFSIREWSSVAVHTGHCGWSEMHSEQKRWPH